MDVDGDCASDVVDQSLAATLADFKGKVLELN